MKPRNLTKLELVWMVGARTGVKQKTAKLIIQTLLDCLRERLSEGESVELRNFGKFNLEVRRGGVGRNPKKPQQAIRYPDRRVVRFRPGKQLRESVL